MFIPLISFGQDSVLTQEINLQLKNILGSNSKEIQYQFIDKKIAINSMPTQEKLNDVSSPNEQEIKELRQWIGTFLDKRNKELSVYKNVSENEKFSAYKNVLVDYSNFLQTSINLYDQQVEKLITNQINYGDFNKFDARQTISERNKRTDYNAAIKKAVQNDYIQFISCVGGINRFLGGQFNQVKQLEFNKLKTTDYCLQFHNPESFGKVIEKYFSNSSGELKFASSANGITTECAGLLGLSFIDIKRSDGKDPKCINLMNQITSDWENVQKSIQENAQNNNARQQQQQSQQTVQRARALAAQDPVARALNYASGTPEDATGPNFFYPIDNSPGKCIYGMKSDNSAMGQMSQSLMGAFASMAPILGAAGIQAPNTATDFDLSKVDLSSVSFYKVNGTTPRTKYSQGTAYLKYQSKVEGLPDYFECDSNTCSIERLQRAWNLVAQTCKGTKKPF